MRLRIATGMRAIFPILLAALGLGACVGPGKVPAPRVVPVAAVALPLPPPVAPQPVPSGDWRDWPVTPGDWVYRRDARGSIALFGPAGGDALVILRCDRLAGQVFLSRRGEGNPAITLRATSMVRMLESRPTGATPAYMAVALSPADPLLDAIGFSRGRFVIEQSGLPILVVPAWPEILRVTEDCRR